MADALLESLKRERAGYAEEGQWIRFLLDAFAGTGGFQGKVRQPAAGYWGAAAELYSATSFSESTPSADLDTYLDRYGREDDPKFAQRVGLAHYPNYIGPLTELKVSYLLRKAFSREGVPDLVEKWREDVDGRGTTYDELRARIITRTAVTGWCPVLVDMIPNADGMTVAQAELAGTGKPRLIPLWPANLIDWSWNGQEFEWVKIRTDHVVQSTWDAKPQTMRRYAIWTRASAITYEVLEVEEGDPVVSAPVEHPHAFGRVPIAICRHAPAEDDIRGRPMHGQESIEARRLFNLISELDEHLRAQVFAILVLVGMQASGQGEVKVGTDNGLPLSPDAKNVHYYLAPPGSVAETLEKRIECTTREIYRMARVEFTRPQTAGATASGIARAYEFAQTNRALADFARHVALFEEDVDDLVGKVLGVSDDARADERVIAPDSFDIEDLSAEMKTALDAIMLKVGPTAMRLVRLRTIQRMLPRLNRADLEAVEQELQDMADEELQMRAAGLELADAGRKPPPGADPDADPDDGDDEEVEDDEAA